MKKLFTESEIINLYKSGVKTIILAKDDVITPLAKDKLKALGMNISKKENSDSVNTVQHEAMIFADAKTIAIGSDHTGFAVKKILVKLLSERGFKVEDVGTHNEESCDYPDFAYAVALNVIEHKADFGIVIDATGIPSAITANKVKGIRAATCYNEFTAKSAREHNNANVLVLGAKALGEETIKSILEVWLKTEFAGARHQKRLDKISAIENKN
jgi:ribose 5-phosphate isomerase B